MKTERMSERGDNSKKHGLPVISSCLNYKCSKCGFVDLMNTIGVRTVERLWMENTNNDFSVY